MINLRLIYQRSKVLAVVVLERCVFLLRDTAKLPIFTISVIDLPVNPLLLTGLSTINQPPVIYIFHCQSAVILTINILLKTLKIMAIE